MKKQIRVENDVFIVIMLTMTSRIGLLYHSLVREVAPHRAKEVVVSLSQSEPQTSPDEYTTQALAALLLAAKVGLTVRPLDELVKPGAKK